MARFTKVRIWRRWAGSLADLGEATKIAERALVDWHGEIEYSIEVRQWGGLSFRFASFEELRRNILDAELRFTREIRSNIKPKDWEAQTHVTVWIEDGDVAAFLQVEGDDRARVEGLADRLGDVMSRGARWPNVPNAVIWGFAGFALALTFFLAVLLGSNVLWRFKLAAQNGLWEPAEFVLMIGIALVDIPLLILIWWLFPNLELLPAATRTRLHRFRGGLVVIVLGVASSLVASTLLLFLPFHA